VEFRLIRAPKNARVARSQWGPKVSDGQPVTEKFVYYMYKYAAFDIKPI